MPTTQVNATRMELTNLKRKLTTARKGHKLLKDKRDELMRQFMNMVKENLELRLEVENAINKANVNMAVAGSVMQKEILQTALLLPKQKVSVNVKQKNVMSVLIPEFEAEFKTSGENNVYSYGYAFTSGELDGAVKQLADIFPKMLELAQKEKSCRLLADEIEKTRRRVNALEHVMIPRYEENIRYITMKLDENERSTTSRLMKVKDMMIKEKLEK